MGVEVSDASHTKDLLQALRAAEISGETLAAVDQLASENDLLRASLAQMAQRLAELEALADTDIVTPLPNRRRLLREMERVIGQADRHGTPAALLFIDVNGLKGINDRHGHLAGDAALIHVARMLTGLIRTTDVLARIGGDEFGLLVDHLDHNSAIDTAERLAQCIADNPLDIGGQLVPIAASIGVATILPGDSAEDVLQRADRNMYRAKEEA
jgi:diguanylate cyclase (GGDEF)-like protein